MNVFAEPMNDIVLILMMVFKHTFDRSHLLTISFYETFCLQNFLAIQYTTFKKPRDKTTLTKHYNGQWNREKHC